MRTMKSIKRGLVALGAVLLVALSASLANAQNLPPTWVFARAYNGWNIVGQQANTYTFNGGVCNFSPSNNGNTPSFFVFSGYNSSTPVYYPVLITDAKAAYNEIVTPTSTTQSSSSCGFAASTSYSHTSFVLSSGTIGLQEAIITQQQNTPVFSVILDKYWYQQVAALPGAPSAASIIAAVKGNADVGIVDITTMPWTYYSWSGSAYVQASLSFTSGYFPVSVTETLAAPGNVRSIVGNMTTTNASYANGGNSLVGVRGATTIGGSTTVASGYLYGTQGKVIFAGTSDTQSGGGIIAGTVGQLDLTGATLTNTGLTAPGWFDVQAGPSASIANLHGILITNSSPTTAGSAIHVATTSSGFTNFFTIDDVSGTLATVTGTPGTCTNSGYLNVKVNSTALKIPFCQ